MEGNPIIDLRIHELCKNRLKLGEQDATLLSKYVQQMFEEERELLLKHYAEIERTYNLHKDLFEKKYPGVNHVDIMQWMFTYFAFVMGGVVAILLILLKK